MNWKNLVESNNAKVYVLPPGWDNRAKVAEQLECSEERVRILLAPAVKAGTVETKVFPIWDRILKRITKVVAYRRQETPPRKAR